MISNTDIQFELNHFLSVWRKFRHSVKDPMDVPNGDKIFMAISRARELVEKELKKQAPGSNVDSDTGGA